MAPRRGWIDRNFPALALWLFIIGAVVLVKQLQQRTAAGG